jgi:DNA-binding MarR family transcriptional regulator
VNECIQPNNGDQEPDSRSPALHVDGAVIKAATETMRKVAEVSRSLKSVVSLMETLVQTASGDSGLTLAHCLILVNLSRAHTCKQSDLHSETRITAGYITRLIDELVAKRMVHRRRSTKDRRQILLSLTDHGKDATLSLLAAIDRRPPLNALDKMKSSLDRFMAVCAPDQGSEPKTTA